MPDLLPDVAQQLRELTVDALPPGGTSGQVLTKLSNDDSDADWETPTPSTTYSAGVGLDLTGTTFSTNDQEAYTSASVSGATTVSFATARVHALTMTGNITLTLSGATSGKACGLTLYLIQDGTGSRLVTWPGSVKWPSGQIAVLSIAASAIDIVVLETVDGGTTWFANLAGRGYA